MDTMNKSNKNKHHLFQKYFKKTLSNAHLQYKTRVVSVAVEEP